MPQATNEIVRKPNYFSYGLAALFGVLLLSVYLTDDGQNFGHGGDIPKVIDGDTLQIDGITYDLFGIDAPELGQDCLNGDRPWHCGHLAALELHKWLVFDVPDCRPVDQHPASGNAVRKTRCKAGTTTAAGVLLSTGLAVANNEAPPDYLIRQDKAKRASVGIWRGNFTQPGDWRAGQRPYTDNASAIRCPVKAVATRQSKHLYYVLLDEGFPLIDVKDSPGGKCFLSDEAARAAGYRHPASQKQSR